MLKILTKYLLKLKDLEDVRETILGDFFLKDLTALKNKDNNLLQIFDSEKIKECVLKSKENQNFQRQSLNPRTRSPFFDEEIKRYKEDILKADKH
jgi:hypothetical protein